MNVPILLFAPLRDRAGKNRLAVKLRNETATLTDLRAVLAEDFPMLAESLPSAVAAINQEFAFDADVVKDGDEVAFFPPVSGGQTQWPEIYQVAQEPIDLNALTKAI